MWRDSESSDDFLNFTELADQVATLATTQALLPISIGIFGSWGTGKSTVLKLVRDRIPGDGPGAPVVVHFDAWLYQGFDDAKAALMEVISYELIALAKRKETFVEKAKAFAGRINYFRGLGLVADFGLGMALGIPPGLLTSAGSAVSALISGAGVSGDEYDKVKKDAGALAKGFGGLLKPEERKTPPEEIKAFRAEFAELLEGLDTSLVVFIDNLDRCLPDTAIGTLEAIRLFLFMERTAFVIAADEDMIRHSVAKHFDDPNSAHVRDYLDKVIQVPLRVPQVGVDELRAYMYSLMVADAAPDKLPTVQARLLDALQTSWKGGKFDRAEIDQLAGAPAELRNDLAVADRLAPILATAPNVQGNPRIVKRLLNAVSLRRAMVGKRQMNVDLATLAKLAVFERCTDGPATLTLYRLVMEGEDAEKLLMPPSKGKGAAPALPTAWAAHAEFIEQWRAMEPIFSDAKALRPAVFLSRDVMAPAPSRTGLSDAAREAVEALLKVDRVTSPVARTIVERLSAPDRRAAMVQIIDTLRSADWTSKVEGVHGAIILAKASTDAAAELQAFVGSLQTGNLEPSVKYLLTQHGLLEKS